MHLIDAGDVRNPEKLVPFLGEVPDEIKEEADEDGPAKTACPGSSKEGRLYKINDEDGDGEIEYEIVSDSPPYSQAMLDSSACYILGNPSGPSGYIWKGKNSSSEERSKGRSSNMRQV